ncbi:MAG: hypothetical protein V3V97_09190 [Hyphomicrobiaceae bacterium]
MGHIINCLFLTTATAVTVGLLMWLVGHADIVIAYSMTALGVGILVGSIWAARMSRF